MMDHNTNFTTLHYTKLHYTTLHYTTLLYTTLHYTTLHYTTLHYTTLHYTTLHYTTLHYTTPGGCDFVVLGVEVADVAPVFTYTDPVNTVANGNPYRVNFAMSNRCV